MLIAGTVRRARGESQMAETADLLEQVWSSLIAIGEAIERDDPRRWDLATDLPGWSVKDLYSHMIGTESTLAGLPAPEIDVPDAPHLRNDVGRMNEQWVERFRPESGAAVLATFREITGARLDALRALTPDEWEAETFTPE